MFLFDKACQEKRSYTILVFIVTFSSQLVIFLSNTSTLPSFLSDLAEN